MDSINLSIKELEALRRLKTRDDIVIKPADKGGAVCVWSKDKYIEEGERQLRDERFYKKLENDKTESIQKDIVHVLEQMIDEEKLPKKAKSLIVRAPRCAAFYLLPKIHKENIPGRPVVSNISCPTYHISKFLSSQLKPIVRSCPGYIKDTTHLLQKIEDLNVNGREFKTLFTLDVKGLYTNIPNETGLQALKYYLDRREEKEIPTDVLLRLAELVLTVNCVEFNGEYYSQVSGTMMGTPAAVEYSCLTMSHQEKKIDDEYTDEKPILYVRYIDDVFGVSTLHSEKFEKFLEFVKTFHPSIQYTSEIGTKVNMLDTTLYIENNAIVSTLYTKPTDSHAYLRYSSSHPTSCKNNIPYSQFLRVRRICTKDSDFKKESDRMLNNFLSLGYPRKVLQKARRKAERCTRKDLLKPKEAKQEDSERIVFPINFHPRNDKVTKIVKQQYSLTLQSDDEVGDVFKEMPMLAFRRDKNLKDILVHSKLRSNVGGGTFRCNRPRCKTCPHVLGSDETIIGPRGSFAIHQRFTCTSAGLVYCIICKKCGELYVGETGRLLGDRFREHRKDVEDNVAGKQVASHFNQDDHQGVDDMQVTGLRLVNGLISRKLEEQKIIAKLGCVLGRGMNTDFNFPFLFDD